MNGNATDMVSLSVNNNICDVQAADNEDYIDESVVLHVSLVDDNMISNTVTIYIDSVF